MEMQFNYICKCVTFGTMIVSSFNGFFHKLIEIAPFIQLYIQSKIRLGR